MIIRIFPRRILKRLISGFTIIELLIVIAVIGVLSTIGVLSYTSIQKNVRDNERSTKIKIIASALEEYYEEHGEYPSCNAMSQPVDVITNTTLSSVEPNVFKAPSGENGTSSFLPNCGDLLDGVDAFAYVGDNSTPCTTSTGQEAACLQYTLKYLVEGDSDIVSITSKHVVESITAPTTPNLVVALNGGNVLATASASTCPVGTVEYGFRSRINDGAWSSYSAWATTTTATQVANQGVKYGYQVQSRCNLSTTQMSLAVASPEGTYVRPITAPGAPVIVTPAVSDITTTTWTWNAVSCAAGTTARYQYDYLINSVSQAPSGWKTPATSGNTSIAFTTTTPASTYAVVTQAQCYTTFAVSGWSASSNTVSYLRIYPITAIAAITGAVSPVGSSLTAGALTPAAATVSYQWQKATTVGGVYANISGATSSSYTIKVADVGKYIKVVATGTGGYSGTQISAATAQITDSSWITIGTQVWAKYNQNVGTMVTGTVEMSNNAVLEKYCYNNTASNCTTYGGLYQWNEAMQYVMTEGAQGICPVGSHIPTDDDWKILEVQLGMTQVQADTWYFRGTDQGTKLKPGGSSGLELFLVGYRGTAGNFAQLSLDANYYTSSVSSTYSVGRHMQSALATVYRGVYNRTDGFAVRCLGN